jgi:uncharacterized protein YciI
LAVPALVPVASRPVAYFVVTRERGPGWDGARAMREQDGWDAHAAFMDALAEERFIVLGGPLGDEVRTAHVVEAESEQAIRETMARDPWSESHLVVDSIDPWTILLDGRVTP